MTIQTATAAAATATTAIASTGHRIIVDRAWSGDWRVSLEGDLDTMPDVSYAEIDAVCAAAGLRCRNEWRETWSPCDVLAVEVVS